MAHVEPITALRLISEGAQASDLESQTLDFKEEASDRKKTIKDLVSASVCFANAEGGGTIVLGIRDKQSEAKAFAGATISVEEAKSRIFDLTRPPLLVDVSELIFHDGSSETRLLEIVVPDSSEVHSDTQGRFTMRVGTDCLSMDANQQLEARARKSQLDWSARIGQYTVSDVSETAVEAARDRLRNLPDTRRELADVSLPDLMRALGVTTDDGRLLNAGEVLFMQAPSSSRSRALYEYRETPGGEPTATERLDGPLISVLARTMELVQARRKLTPVTLPTGQQLQIEDFPEAAVREAIANGLLHRDYHVNDSVVVDHSPEVFVVTSPGPLVAGITPDNILTHPSRPRNARLARAAQFLGLIEERGRGVDRIYREMIRSGQKLPTIENFDQSVRLTLVGGAPNTQLARYVAGLPEAERADVDTMLILVTLCTRKTVTAETAAPILQKSGDEAGVVLRRLASDEISLLEPTRETAGRSRPTYRLRTSVLQALGGAVAYGRRTTDDVDRKVIEHMTEYGKITNRTVRNLLDLSTSRAAAILGDLVKREIIVKTSEATRGPSVEYGPGPEFPRAKPRKRAASKRAVGR